MKIKRNFHHKLTIYSDWLFNLFLFVMVLIAGYYIFNVNSFNYEVLPANVDINIYNQINQGYKLISVQEANEIRSYYNKFFWLIAFCMVGYFYYSPSMRKGISKFIKKYESFEG